MDMKDASAMTEASGLVNDHDGTELAAGARPAGTEASARPLAMSSQDELIRWTDRLREVTVKAPLRSLFAAFLVGLWVARRR
ncbi:hypothetical protein [Bradyrhizobium sp. Arg816]|uniref:hypothetical protein n=1 Tax=Bradyrhizobium sp. Arg816 TaxID=2998491 RepID=UPI00249EE0DB|nr:hypothetical protein [Bradyrhizobium sp. Arg816]MDI3562402.1 hypothetical protein [Bradyrhizobium sp. Arg816]